MLQPEKHLAGAPGTGARALGGGAGPGAPAHQGRSENKPPYSNTGVPTEVVSQNALHVGVDYFRGTTFYTESYVLRYLSDLLGESVEVLGRGKNGYTRGYKLGEVSVFASDRSSMGVNIELSGEGCAAVGFHTLRTIYHVLELSVSRFDLAADNCPFTVEVVRDSWQAGLVRSYVRPPKAARPEWADVRNCRYITSHSGDTFYMGSRSSEQFARCYNEKGFTRFELELKDKKARLAAKKIFDVDEAELPALALGMVRGFVDFCEPGSRREHDKLLPWWSEFVGMFEGVVLSIPKKVQKVLEDALSYVVVQHGKTLKAAFQAFGFSEVLDRIDEQRFSVKHRRMLADYYKQKEADELRLFRQPSDLCGQIGMCT